MDNDNHETMNDKALTTSESQELGVTRRQPTPLDLLQAALEGGITEQNIAVVERMAALAERFEQRNAEKDFAAAFVELQKELPVIQGYRPIPDKQGRTKFCYANFEDIDAIVRPLCLARGFTYSFHESAVENGRVTVTMTLQHSGGHARLIPYSVRSGHGPPGASESQADVSGHTYAQRGAIESGLALRIIGRPEDPRMEGGPVTQGQADELERRIKMTNSDVQKFLRLAGVDSFEKIPAAKYDVLDQLLRQKEGR